MERPVDHIQLVFPSQPVEAHRVARYPDGEVGVLLRVLHGIEQQLPVQHVHVEMESARG